MECTCIMSTGDCSLVISSSQHGVPDWAAFHVADVSFLDSELARWMFWDLCSCRLWLNVLCDNTCYTLQIYIYTLLARVPFPDICCKIQCRFCSAPCDSLCPNRFLWTGFPWNPSELLQFLGITPVLF